VFSGRDVDLFYRIDGPTDAHALVFPNSLGTTNGMWDAVVDRLDKQFRCIRYDTRGHGASTVSSGAFGIADIADDLAALLEHLGLAAAHVAGLSLGERLPSCKGTHRTAADFVHCGRCWWCSMSYLWRTTENTLVYRSRITRAFSKQPRLNLYSV
jgi:pimeloyl-ACP methyl ester carboxylesterase